MAGHHADTLRVVCEVLNDIAEEMRSALSAVDVPAAERDACVFTYNTVIITLDSLREQILARIGESDDAYGPVLEMRCECQCGFASHSGAARAVIDHHIASHRECCGDDSTAHRVVAYGWNAERSQQALAGHRKLGGDK